MDELALVQRMPLGSRTGIKMTWSGVIPTTDSAVTATVDVGAIVPYMSRKWAVCCVIPGSCAPPLGGPPESQWIAVEPTSCTGPQER